MISQLDDTIQIVCINSAYGHISTLAAINIQTAGITGYNATFEKVITKELSVENGISVAIVKGSSGVIDFLTSQQITITSDERIKENIKDINGSLDIIDKINIRQYDYIDKTKGKKVTYDIIAQELEKVFPEAVNHREDYIPSIFCLSTNISIDKDIITITLDKMHNLCVKDDIKLITKTSLEKYAIVTSINDNYSFTIDRWESMTTDQIFVYGKYVKDFHVVDKIHLGTLALAGVKELNQIVQQQQQLLARYETRLAQLELNSS